MHAVIRSFRDTVFRAASSLIPDESIVKSKEKWERLSSRNARYYILSRKGEGIQEEDFRSIGAETYEAFIKNDPLVRECIGPYGDKKALDIGCGIGRIAEFLAQDFSEVHGIDISGGMVSRAEKRLANVPNIHFHATDGLTYPFADGRFDLVFSYMVFQHMPTREVVEQNFKEVRRVLSPRGIAKIQIRGGKTPFKWQWFYGPAFDKESAFAMVKRAGLKIVRSEGEATKFFWLWLVPDDAS